MKYKVLNDQGSVELMSHTPDGDLLVVNAARCSFDKQSDDFNEQDFKLVNFLAREKHLLPFRHPQVTLRITAPIFVFRQIGKHQVGFSWSEVSRRYIKSRPSFYLPKEWRGSAENIKQGSAGVLDEEHSFSANVTQAALLTQAVEAYDKLLLLGVAPEQARIVLPQSMITTTVTTGSLLGWFHMFNERTNPTAQKETQEYAVAVANIMYSLYPSSWEALCEHCC